MTLHKNGESTFCPFIANLISVNIGGQTSGKEGTSLMNNRSNRVALYKCSSSLRGLKAGPILIKGLA